MYFTKKLFLRGLEQIYLLSQRKKPNGCEGEQICQALGCSSCCHIHVIHNHFYEDLFPKVRDLLLQNSRDEFLLFLAEVAICAEQSLEVNGRYIGSYPKLFSEREMEELAEQTGKELPTRFVVYTFFACNDLEETTTGVYDCRIYPKRPDGCRLYKCHLLQPNPENILVKYPVDFFLAAYQLTEKLITWPEANQISMDPSKYWFNLKRNGAVAHWGLGFR